MNEENLIKWMDYSTCIKKDLSIAVNVGCCFVCDAEDAAKLLSLITFHEAHISALETFVDELIKVGNKVVNEHSMWIAEEDDWYELVKDWKVSEE